MISMEFPSPQHIGWTSWHGQVDLVFAEVRAWRPRSGVKTMSCVEQWWNALRIWPVMVDNLTMVDILFEMMWNAAKCNLWCSSEICCIMLYLFRDPCTSWQSGSGCTLAAPSRFGRGVSRSKRIRHEAKAAQASSSSCTWMSHRWSIHLEGKSLTLESHWVYHWVPRVNLTYLNISSHQVSRHIALSLAVNGSKITMDHSLLRRASHSLGHGRSEPQSLLARSKWRRRCSFPIFVPLSFPKVTPNPEKKH